MIDLKEFQKELYRVKVEKGFNIDDVELQFNFLHGEVSEAFDAYRKKKDDLPEELADIVIYALGTAEMLGINLEEELVKKLEKVKRREYKSVNGVFQRVKEG